MKPTPDTPEWKNFKAKIKQIVSVPKTEILRLEQQAKEQRKAKRASASSGRVSRAKER